MPSATTNRLCCSEMANESSFEVRLRPTSVRPALVTFRRASGTALLLHAGPLLRSGQLLELRQRGLVGRLPRQNRPQLVHRLALEPRVAEREREVQARDLVVRIGLDGAPERG